MNGTFRLVDKREHLFDRVSALNVNIASRMLLQRTNHTTILLTNIFKLCVQVLFKENNVPYGLIKFVQCNVHIIHLNQVPGD